MTDVRDGINGWGPVRPRFCPFCGDEHYYNALENPTGGVGKYKIFCRRVEPECFAEITAYVNSIPKVLHV